MGHSEESSCGWGSLSFQAGGPLAARQGQHRGGGSRSAGRKYCVVFMHPRVSYELWVSSPQRGWAAHSDSWVPPLELGARLCLAGAVGDTVTRKELTPRADLSNHISKARH